MSGYTKGPWKLRHDRQIVGPNGRSIARAHQDTRFRSDEETAANGLVLAAAPELLEALEAFVNYSAADNGDVSILSNDDLWINAERAIAKARGEA